MQCSERAATLAKLVEPFTSITSGSKSHFEIDFDEEALPADVDFEEEGGGVGGNGLPVAALKAVVVAAAAAAAAAVVVVVVLVVVVVVVVEEEEEEEEEEVEVGGDPFPHKLTIFGRKNTFFQSVFEPRC